MPERYFGNVVSTLDRYTVVMDKGSEHGIKMGDKFLVVGLGPPILDLVTHEEIERLENVRGMVSIVHVQNKISTARSCEFVSPNDVKDVKKLTARDGIVIVENASKPEDSVTEAIKPLDTRVKPLDGAQIGDLLIRQ